VNEPHSVDTENAVMHTNEDQRERRAFEFGTKCHVLKDNDGNVVAVRFLGIQFNSIDDAYAFYRDHMHPSPEAK
jgi:hypothetical protein